MTTRHGELNLKLETNPTVTIIIVMSTNNGVVALQRFICPLLCWFSSSVWQAIYDITNQAFCCLIHYSAYVYQGTDVELRCEPEALQPCFVELQGEFIDMSCTKNKNVYFVFAY